MSPVSTPATGARRVARGGRKTSVFSRGEPLLWLTAGALALLLLMIGGLLALVVAVGGLTFWPEPIARVETVDGRALLGELFDEEAYAPEDHAFDALPAEHAEAARRRVAEAGGVSRRIELRTGNFDLTGTHFTWVSDFEVTDERYPERAVLVERLSGWGRFYGIPVALEVDGEPVAADAEAVDARYEELHGVVRERWAEARDVEEHELGRLHDELEEARLELVGVELAHGKDSAEWREAAAEFAALEVELAPQLESLSAEVARLDAENARYVLVVETADGVQQAIPLAEIVRTVAPNRLGVGGKLAVFSSRWFEYLTEEPRDANNAGGIAPAILCTVAMTLIMSLFVVPFGVLAALYLREYAKAGPVISAVRIAVNNLAGVPSIVYGVFGFGFFCYVVGASIDDVFFAEKLPNPTYGTGGLLWASLTLALLTLPVVIVATEESLAAVPGSMREGSYACGATKWQTIRRIVLPRAMPGIMTGMILAVARGAGEVAPLMLVGVVKMAPELPVEFDGLLPSVHPERSFMHLGFHIYDLGFQSQNSEAAKPMVYTTTLLLIGIIVCLNLAAISVRGRLRKRFEGSAV